MLNKNRKSIRLQNYDYSTPNAYFVTICTKNKIPFFGDVRGGKIISNEIGEIAKRCWIEIPEHFPAVILDEFVIMPNHIHGILIIYYDDHCNVGNAYMRSLHFADRTKMLLPKAIHGFKAVVTRVIRKGNICPGFVWQKSYYDHIIRNEKSMQRIREYIENNPTNWQWDIENLNVQKIFSEKDKEDYYRKLYL